MRNESFKRKAAGSLVWVSAVAVALLLLPAERPAAAPPQQPSADNKPLSAADTDDLYQEKCALCHGADRAGKPNFPTLVGVTTKYHDAEIATQIRKGKGRMPAFPSLTDAEVNALIAYLKTPAPTPAPGN